MIKQYCQHNIARQYFFSYSGPYTKYNYMVGKGMSRQNGHE